MKNIIFIFCISLYGTLCANPIVGHWKINQIIGIHEYEYVLQELSENNKYGNYVAFHESNTFVSFYSAECGTTCKTRTYGSYEFEGERHVRLTLKKVERHGMRSFCPQLDTTMIKDLGLFYIHKDTFYIYEGMASIKLIPSDGDLVSDTQNAEYSKIIDNFDYETRDVPNLIYIATIPVESE